MATAARAEGDSRRIVRPISPVKVKREKPERLPAVRDLLKQIDLQVQRGEYTIKGRVHGLITSKGNLEFGKDGPVVAELTGGGLALLDTWRDLPPVRKLYPGELCPACLAKCDECAGTGKRPCRTRCGGSGEIVVDRKLCNAARCSKKTGHPNAKCAVCHGRGDVPVYGPCPNCQGSKSEKCPLCIGTGQMSCGRVRDGKGAVDAQGHADRSAEVCPECEGNDRRLERNPQDLAHFVHGRLQGYVAIGPILKLVWDKLPDDENAPPRGWYGFGPDAQGNFPVLLIKQPTPGERMYIFGGQIPAR